MQQWWSTNATNPGGEIGQMFYLILYGTLALFAVVELGVLLSMARRRTAGRNLRTEVIWTVIPALVLLATLAGSAWPRRDARARIPQHVTPIAAVTSTTSGDISR